MYQTIILGSILLVSFYILKRFRKPKLNMPPLVRYKIPIIGHTYSYMFNSEEFIKQCKKEYGEIFSIYIWGEVRTIVGKEYSQEVLTRDDAFSFGKAFVETIPLDLLLKHAGVTNVPKLLKDYIFCKLNFYSEHELLQGPNPKSFEPFRHIDKNAPASKISKNFVLFGAGKHACPGRYFAISEIKFFMHNIILKYNIRTESGKIEGRKLYGPTAYPSPSGIIIEKRKAK
ncbi:unnamed protein product [Rhizophagus irregularis]|uniref:Cytochrome P450 n=2 Tax=Rhizophagus irregularis TaxID=588596 RepID=A0A915YWR8_9GLOM|nr:unnamed protein product [Rhizophagus irregularis]CAB5347492.1 unnamed protein product [Rhizophagus irregularis]